MPIIQLEIPIKLLIILTSRWRIWRIVKCCRLNGKLPRWIHFRGNKSIISVLINQWMELNSSSLEMIGFFCRRFFLFFFFVVGTLLSNAIRQNSNDSWTSSFFMRPFFRKIRRNSKMCCWTPHISQLAASAPPQSAFWIKRNEMNSIELILKKSAELISRC